MEATAVYNLSQVCNGQDVDLNHNNVSNNSYYQWFEIRKFQQV